MKTVTNNPAKTLVEIRVKYPCTKCGHTFYRKNKGDFSANPLLAEEYNNARRKLHSELYKRVRKCPKCSCDVKPKEIIR